jgi:hypothetical protein
MMLDQDCKWTITYTVTSSLALQDCSCFSGRAFSCHQSPAPEITTQQIRCWELMTVKENLSIIFVGDLWGNLLLSMISRWDK